MTSFCPRVVAFSAAIILAAALSAHAQVSAMDNFENNNPGTAYNDGIQYGDNGGVGFGALTYLEGTGGGVFDASLDGARALGIYADGGGQGLGRTTQDPFSTGVYSLNARFDLDNATGTSGFNIKSALGSTFGSNEELFFGLTPGSGNSSIFISDGTGNHTLSLPGVGELRGTNLNFSVSFDTLADSYTLRVTDPGAGGATNSFSGSLKDTNGAAAGSGAINAIGFLNFNTSSGTQNLIADDLSMVPEPSTWAIGSLSAVGLVGSAFRRFRRAG